MKALKLTGVFYTAAAWICCWFVVEFQNHFIFISCSYGCEEALVDNVSHQFTTALRMSRFTTDDV